MPRLEEEKNAACCTASAVAWSPTDSTAFSSFKFKFLLGTDPIPRSICAMSMTKDNVKDKHVSYNIKFEPR